MKSVKSRAAPRLYIGTGLRPGAEIALSEAARAHAAALRLRAGDAVRLFDGSGGEYAASLTQAGRDLHASVGEFADSTRESPLRVTLGTRTPVTMPALEQEQQQQQQQQQQQ